MNTSMYDAQQGSTSGAHIDMSTASGTNDIHGQLYGHRGTNWLNADPYFYNADPNIPQDEKNPGLHRYTAGGAVGLPIIKNKLFFYGSYQHTHASDEEIGISRPTVPPGLTNDRSARGAGSRCEQQQPLTALRLGRRTHQSRRSASRRATSIRSLTRCLITSFSCPRGQYLIPSANPNAARAEHDESRARSRHFPRTPRFPAQHISWPIRPSPISTGTPTRLTRSPPSITTSTIRPPLLLRIPRSLAFRSISTRAAR